MWMLLLLLQMSTKSLKEYYDEYKALEDDHDKAMAYAQDQVNRDRDLKSGRRCGCVL